jgi:hypothetical protein
MWIAQLAATLPHPNGWHFPRQPAVPSKENVKAVITRSGKTMAEPKAKSKKMSPTNPVEEEEKAEAEVEVESRPEKEEENLGKASPKDINDTWPIPEMNRLVFAERCGAAILHGLPDKMGDLGVPTISYLIGTQKIGQALCDLGASVKVMPKVIYDQLNHDSLFPTSMHLQLADQSIRHPEVIEENIPVRIRNSFILLDFVVFEMDVYHQIPLILGRPFLSIVGATIDVVDGIIKLNISGKGETFTFKPKGTE